MRTKTAMHTCVHEEDLVQDLNSDHIELKKGGDANRLPDMTQIGRKNSNFVASNSLLRYA